MRRHYVAVCAGALIATSSAAYAQTYDYDRSSRDSYYQNDRDDDNRTTGRTWDRYSDRDYGRDYSGRDHMGSGYMGRDRMGGDRMGRDHMGRDYSDRYSRDTSPGQRWTGSRQAQDSSARTGSLPQQIRSRLESQGYQDVRIAAGSYVVTARDNQGDQVLMLIGPHSVTVLQGMSTSGGSGAQSGMQSGTQSQSRWGQSQNQSSSGSSGSGSASSASSGSDTSSSQVYRPYGGGSDGDDEN